MPRGNYGIFEMPTIGEQIGPELQTLATTLQKFRNPNQDIQKALREAVAQNPAILQQLIDLGPEKVATIFGKEASFLGQGEQSLSKRIETEAGSLFGSSPEFKSEAIAKATGTQTPVQREGQKLDIEGKKIGNTMAASQTRVQQETEDAQIADYMNKSKILDQQVTDMQQAVNAIPNIGAIDIGKVARDAFRGRGDAMTMMRLQQAGINIAPLVGSLQQQAQISAQWSLETLRQKSKDVQVMSLAPLEKMADDNRNMIAQYDSVIKNLGEGYRMARMMTRPKNGKVDTNNPLYTQSMETIRQYEDAMRGRQRAIEDYERYNTKRKELVGVIYNMNGPASTESPPPITEVVPKQYAPAIEALQGMSPQDRKAALDEVKRNQPLQFDAIAPYVNVLDTTTTKTATNIPTATTTTTTTTSTERKGNAAQALFGALQTTTRSKGISNEDYGKAAAKISKALGIVGPKVLKILKDYGNDRLGKSRDENRVLEYLQAHPDSLPSVDVDLPNVKGPTSDLLATIRAVKNRAVEPSLMP